MAPNKEWFIEWFDSDWYDMLYSDRDEQEASAFIRNLLAYLQPSKDSHFLDLACGSGRHSLYLNSLGYRVTGLDLSRRKIMVAQQKQRAGLGFEIHDMREVYAHNTFDFVLNLFTSFGYFENLEDHLKTLRAVREELKPGGRLVIDYFNSKNVRQHLPYSEVIEKEGTTFQIRKNQVGNSVVKSITIPEHDLHFEEKVRLFTVDDFRIMLEESDFEIQTIFGNYKLEPFEDITSDRLIIVAS